MHSTRSVGAASSKATAKAAADSLEEQNHYLGDDVKVVKFGVHLRVEQVSMSDSNYVHAGHPQTTVDSSTGTAVPCNMFSLASPSILNDAWCAGCAHLYIEEQSMP